MQYNCLQCKSDKETYEIQLQNPTSLFFRVLNDDLKFTIACMEYRIMTESKLQEFKAVYEPQEDFIHDDWNATKLNLNKIWLPNMWAKLQNKLEQYPSHIHAENKEETYKKTLESYNENGWFFVCRVHEQMKLISSNMEQLTEIQLNRQRHQQIDRCIEYEDERQIRLKAFLFGDLFYQLQNMLAVLNRKK